jgi:hypothetical protein
MIPDVLFLVGVPHDERLKFYRPISQYLKRYFFVKKEGVLFYEHLVISRYPSFIALLPIACIPSSHIYLRESSLKRIHSDSTSRASHPVGF